MAAGVLFWSLREVLIHLFAGVVLAMALCTLVGELRSRKPMPRSMALLICLVGLVLVVSMATAIVVPPFTEQFHQLLLQLPSAAKELWKLAIGAINQTSEMVY